MNKQKRNFLKSNNSVFDANGSESQNNTLLFCKIVSLIQKEAFNYKCHEKVKYENVCFVDEYNSHSREQQ